MGTESCPYSKQLGVAGPWIIELTAGLENSQSERQVDGKTGRQRESAKGVLMPPLLLPLSSVILETTTLPTKAATLSPDSMGFGYSHMACLPS